MLTSFGSLMSRLFYPKLPSDYFLKLLNRASVPHAQMLLYDDRHTANSRIYAAMHQPGTIY